MTSNALKTDIPGIALPASPPLVRVETRDGTSTLTLEQVKSFQSDFFDGWLEFAESNQAGDLELMLPVNTKVWKRAVTCMETKYYCAPPSWADDGVLSQLLSAQLDYYGPRPLIAAITCVEAAAREEAKKLRFRSPPVTRVDVDSATWQDLVTITRRLRADAAEPSAEAMAKYRELADIWNHVAQSTRFQFFPALGRVAREAADHFLSRANDMQKLPGRAGGKRPAVRHGASLS